MTIKRFYPYRVLDGDSGRQCIGKYLWEKKSEAKSKSGVLRRGSCTWKMWNTPFVNDLDTGDNFAYWKRHGKSVFAYVLESEDEWIEFISPEPDWKIHRKKSIPQLINYYLKR